MVKLVTGQLLSLLNARACVNDIGHADEEAVADRREAGEYRASGQASAKRLCATLGGIGTIDVLADTWTYLIIREAFFGARRFAEFQRKLGIPRATLSKRLTGHQAKPDDVRENSQAL
jgi:hypothetical protein